MKIIKRLFTLALVIPNITFALSLKEAESFQVPTEKNEVFDFTFDETPAKKFTLNGDAGIIKGEGYNGTAAFRISRRDPMEYKLSGIPLGKLDNNTRYNVSFYLRGKDLVCDGMTKGSIQVLGVDHSLKGKWLSGSYHYVPVPGEAWTSCSFSFVPPPEADKSQLLLYLSKKWTGTVWLDDIKIFSEFESPTFNLLKPANLSIWGNEAKIKFLGSQGCLPQTPALVQFGNQKQIAVADANRLFNAVFRNIEIGKNDLKITLLDPVRKLKIFSESFPVMVYIETDPPADAVVMDKYGRAIINGKPFMPIAIYADPADAATVAEAGFNTIVSAALFGDKHENINRIQAVRKRLDDLQKLNLKGMPGVTQQYPGRDSATQEADGVKGEYNVVSKIAEGVKDHPALLAWYVSDEMPRSGLPMVKKIRESVSLYDPWHPTYTLTCRRGDMPYYGLTGDVVGMDPYPIRSGPGNYSIKLVIDCMKDSIMTGQPVWVTLQIFNWGVFDFAKAPEKFAQSRGPNQDEMLAMPLLAAIYGAKGFICYSYGSVWNRSEQLQPGSGKPQWEKVKVMVKILNELAPFIMGSTKPEISCESIPAEQVHAGAFADDTGNIRVVIVGIEKLAKAIITISGHPDLKSKFNRTRNLGGGRYEFTAEGVQGDILY